MDREEGMSEAPPTSSQSNTILYLYKYDLYWDTL